MTAQDWNETDITNAVRALTKVQRQFVKDRCIHGDFTMTTVRALIRKRLFHVVPTSPNGQYGTARLTPFGKAVRERVQ